MKSFSSFISEETTTYGWTTKRHADGYDWEVHKWQHGKDKETLHSGKEENRQAAVEKAKTHCKKYEKKAKK